MKNIFKILLLLTVFFGVACSNDKDSWDSDSRELTVGKLTVVTAVRGDTAIAEANSNFFVDEDILQFKYNHAGASPVSFTCEMTDDGWSDLSKALYYSYIYSDKQELESFVAEYGTQGLTADQSTEQKYHSAHYLQGDAYVKDKTTLIRVDSMLNQHVKVIVKIQKSVKWVGASDFMSVMDQAALVIHTAAGDNILPLYDDTQDDCAVYSAILPVDMVPAEGSSIFTIKGKPATNYKLVNGAASSAKGQTLIVTAKYDNVNAPVATALTKKAWDTFEGMQYGYPVIKEIYTLMDLEAFAASVSSGVDYKGKDVRLMNDLNIGYELINPIGTRNRPFNGSFYGDKKIISDFVISTDYANTGLFAAVGAEGTVRELTLINARVESTENYTAALAGSNYGYIVACQTSGCEITGYNYAASIVGYNEGTVVGCGLQSDAIYTLKAEEAVGGGIAGYNYKRIIACRAIPTTVQVRSSGNKFGAIAGEAPFSATIDRCAWQHAALPALGAGGYVKPINNSTASDMNQAIGEYNGSLENSEERSCPLVW